MGKHDDHAIRSMITHIMATDAGKWFSICKLTNALTRAGIACGGVAVERNVKALVKLGGAKARQNGDGDEYAHIRPKIAFGTPTRKPYPPSTRWK